MINATFFSTSGVYNSSSARAGIPFTPLLVDDFSAQPDGTIYDIWNNRSVYASDQPSASGRSLKLTLLPNTQANLTASSCGVSSHSYGGRSVLPANVPIGKSIWVSWKRFIPVNFTYGYCYGGADNAAAVACSQNGDGNDWLKDLVLAPTNGTSRIYIQPFMRRRNSAQALGNRIITETGPHYNDASSVKYPLGEWFTHQVQVYVHDTAAGFVREWINGDLVNSVTGGNVTSGNSIREFGIGDYWNGVPYTDGTASLSQWVKELIIATDMDGYGAPTGVDSGGRTYIDPLTTVASLT